MKWFLSFGFSASITHGRSGNDVQLAYVVLTTVPMNTWPPMQPPMTEFDSSLPLPASATVR
eukprot:4038692-Prymnesium_polylepis.1